MKNLIDMLNESDLDPSTVSDVPECEFVEFVNSLLDEYSDDIDDDIMITIDNLLIYFDEATDNDEIDIFQDAIIAILESVFDFDSDEDDDNEIVEIAKIKKKRDWAAKRARRRNYVKNKRKISVKAKKYRKTGNFKKFTRKAKKMSKIGRTSTGKRQSTYSTTR